MSLEAFKQKMKQPAGGDINSISGDLARFKIAQVNKEMGFSRVGNQQGSTLWLYHSIKLVTAAAWNTITFFNNVSSQDPFVTNIDAQNGIIGTDESFTACFMQFSAWEYDPVTFLVTKSGIPLNVFGNANLANGFYGGSFQMSIGNEVKIKYNPTQEFHPDFSILAQGAGDPGTVLFFNPIVIPTMQRVKVDLQMPAFTVSSTKVEWLRCAIGGPAAIQSPKVNL